MNKVIEFSAKIKLDNGEIIEVSSESEPTEIIEYDELGYSVEVRNGCVRNREIDEWLDLQAKGDKFQQGKAEELPRWFAVFLPYRDEPMSDVFRWNWSKAHS